MELATLFGACDFEPFSPQSVANYMSYVRSKTESRPSEAFGARFNYPTVEGLKHFALDLLFGDLFTPKSKIPQSFEEFRYFPGDSLTAAILFRRLQVHPETAALEWFAVPLKDFKDDVPEFVLRKARQLVQSARTLRIEGLDLEVVFSASAMPGKIQQPSYVVGGVTLPLAKGTVRPYLDRHVATDYQSAFRDAERLRSAPGGGPIHRFMQLDFEEQLRVDLTATRLLWEEELARADPFLVAKLNVDSNTSIREIVEVWSEREFEDNL